MHVDFEVRAQGAEILKSSKEHEDALKLHNLFDTRNLADEVGLGNNSNGALSDYWGTAPVLSF